MDRVESTETMIKKDDANNADYHEKANPTESKLQSPSRNWHLFLAHEAQRQRASQEFRTVKRRSYRCRAALRILWHLIVKERRREFVLASEDAMTTCVRKCRPVLGFDHMMSPLLGFLADAALAFREYVGACCEVVETDFYKQELRNLYLELDRFRHFVCQQVDKQHLRARDGKDTTLQGAQRLFTVLLRYLMLFHLIDADPASGTETHEKSYRQQLLALLGIYPPCTLAKRTQQKEDLEQETDTHTRVWYIHDKLTESALVAETEFRRQRYLANNTSTKKPRHTSVA